MSKLLRRLVDISKSALKAVARVILPSRTYSRMVKSWHKRRGKKYYETEQVRDFKDFLNDSRLDAVLKEMMLSYERSPGEVMPSNYWKVLNSKNLTQLLETGFENFKQTIALNYSVWLVDENHLQVRFLKDNLSEETVERARIKSRKSARHPFFTPKQSTFYNFMTYILWKYTEREVGEKTLDKISEPMVGNPPAVELNGRFISQDAAHAVLEFDSISSGAGDFKSVGTVLELGAGYGRTAYVALTLMPHLRYIIADIPPALYVSQRYLTEVFPDRKIFKFRDFDSFSEVEKEFYESQVVFVMPHQLRKLPDKAVDLFAAIDCLHEMRPEQIDFYFDTVDRLAKQFYFTCFKSTPLPYEGITLKEEDYPVRSHWMKVFLAETQGSGQLLRSIVSSGGCRGSETIVFFSQNAYMYRAGVPQRDLRLVSCLA